MIRIKKKNNQCKMKKNHQLLREEELNKKRSDTYMYIDIFTLLVD